MFPKVFSRVASAHETANAANFLISEASRQATEQGIKIDDFQIQVSHMKDNNFLVVVIAKSSWSQEHS
jgi:hypothetical protein